jgi:hypothetical protein
VKFFLGTHMPGWLHAVEVPLFVSAIRMRKRKSHRPALRPWALDSGGFSQLTKHGRWTVGPEQYTDEVRAWSSAIGGLCWAAVQDWMCEPHVRALTGLTVEEHQARTVANLHRLRELAPELPWVPVLQGWEPRDYFAHVESYAREGVDLRREPLVGIGSVCRRQETREVVCLIRDLAAHGVKLHGFGFKVNGLTKLAAEGGGLVSADSLAWSYQARKRPPLPGCMHKTCANCKKWALAWREALLAKVGAIGARPRNFDLFEGAA